MKITNSESCSDWEAQSQKKIKTFLLHTKCWASRNWKNKCINVLLAYCVCKLILVSFVYFENFTNVYFLNEFIANTIKYKLYWKSTVKTPFRKWSLISQFLSFPCSSGLISFPGRLNSLYTIILFILLNGKILPYKYSITISILKKQLKQTVQLHYSKVFPLFFF